MQSLENRSQSVLVRAAHSVVWSRLKATNAAVPTPSSEQLRDELIHAGVSLSLGRVVEIARAEGLPLTDVRVDSEAATRRLRAAPRPR